MWLTPAARSPQLQKCRPLVFALAALAMTGSPNVFADDDSAARPRGNEPETQDLEHTIVVGVGGAVEEELTGGSVHSGANIFLEYKAIDHWLELELGVSVLPADGGHEVPIDFLFKKPFQLTRRLEVMLGFGPEVVNVSGTENSGTFFGGEAVADFMFWPSRHVGLWVEPSYDFVFHDGLSHGVGSTGGVIFGW